MNEVVDLAPDAAQGTQLAWMLWLTSSGGDMDYIRNLLHDLRQAWEHFRYIRRHLRQGGNPDEWSF